MTKYQIECNYRLALKRADELSETARNIMKVSENISNDVMAGLEADLHGNSANDYKRKMNLFSAKVENESKLKNLKILQIQFGVLPREHMTPKCNLWKFQESVLINRGCKIWLIFLC